MLFIINVVSGYLQICIQQAIILKITKTNYSLVKIASSSILLTGIVAALYSYISSFYMLMFVFIIVYSLLYFLTFRTPVLKSLLMGMGHIALVNCVEYIFQLALAVLEEIFHYNSQSLLQMIIIRVCGLFLLAAFYVIACRCDLGAFFSVGSKYGHWVISLLFLSFYTLPNILRIEQSQSAGISASNYTLDYQNLLFFFAFFIYNMLYVHSQHKMTTIETQLKSQQLQTDSAEQALSTLKGFKHEFANIINNINGFVGMENWNSLRQYMNKLSINFLKINNTDTINVHLKEIPMLYVVVLTKLSLAEMKNVIFRISVQNEIRLKYCDPTDLGHILGVLIDNALDAAAATEHRFIELEIMNRRGRTLFIVSNSCAQPVDIARIYEDGYSTKENHTGIGLSMVMGTIREYRAKGYDMTIEGKYENNIFTQTVTE